MGDYKILNANSGNYNPNKFNALDSALIYILFLAVFMLAGLASVYIMRLLISLEVNDIYFHNIVSTCIIQLSIAALALLYAKIVRVNLINGGGYRASFKIYPIIFSVLLIAGMIWLFLPVVSEFVDSVYKLGGRRIPEIEAEEADALFGLMFIFVFTTVFPAVCEELLFRAVILRGLTVFGKTFAVIMSSLLFALAHGGFSQFLYQFLVGVAIGTVYVLTKNFLIAVIMHFSNNLFAALFTIIKNAGLLGASEKIVYLNNAMGIIIGTICFFVGAIYFLNYAYKKTERVKEGKEVSAFRSCVAFDKTGSNFVYRNYDMPVPYYTDENPVYFSYNGKSFTPMRRARKKGAKVLMAVGILLALSLVLINYFVSV